MRKLILLIAVLLSACPQAWAASGDLVSTLGDKNSSNVHRIGVDNNGLVTFAQDTGIKYPYTSGSTNQTLTAAQTGTTFILNNGAGVAAGSPIFTLPTAAVGMKFSFVTDLAMTFRIDPQSTDTINYASTAAGYRIRNTSAAIGDSISFFCATANTWSIVSKSGTWAIDVSQN